MMPRPTATLSRKHAIAAALAAASILSLGMAVSTQPASAQITVFDPNNYSQNILTAARTLTQINNQIRSLQNEATMLLNQAKNLSRIDFPEIQAITERLQQIDRLMGQAQGLNFRVSGLDEQLRRLFPQDFSQALSTNDRVLAARQRLDTAMAAYRQTMTVQAQVAENVTADAGTLNAIMAKSQGAEGSLQAAQATNQLLALTAKQQFQIQNLMAAQYRADATEAARRAQAEAEGRAATRKFLGTGSAYPPKSAGRARRGGGPPPRRRAAGRGPAPPPRPAAPFMRKGRLTCRISTSSTASWPPSSATSTAGSGCSVPTSRSSRRR